MSAMLNDKLAAGNSYAVLDESGHVLDVHPSQAGDSRRLAGVED